MNAIKIENVSKKFILSNQRDKLGLNIFSPFSSQKIITEFWALKDVYMEIEKGRVVGIIGRNGAGKTTLLNILAGISSPTMGKIQINGRISSLLTLGAGFQDELTGRENIYLNSSILSIGRNEINKNYRSIIEFSELDGFLDYPLKVYSQGMRLRLGFSVAIHLDFDILLVDEVFSVGDVSFQKKCFDKIEEYKKQGKTIIITTQSLDVVDRICGEAILMENGQIVQRGLPQKVIANYLELLEKDNLSEAFKQRYCVSKWWADKRFWDREEGSKEARITGVKIYNSCGRETSKLKTGDNLKVKVDFVVDKEIEEPHFGVAIFREDGVYCYGPNTHLDGYKIDNLRAGEGFFAIEYKSLCLNPGKYRLSAAIWDKNELWAYDYHAGCYKFEVIGENNNAQLFNLEYKWEPDNGWPRIKIFNFKEHHAFFYSSQKMRNKDLFSPDIAITSLDLLDSAGNPRSAFETGEGIRIKLRLKFLKDRKDYYLWVGLFRGDDVYCHGAAKKSNEETLSLVYPEIPLLSGEYYLSVGIWAKDRREPVLYKHRASNFKISFVGHDHGTAYLEHSWKWKLP